MGQFVYFICYPGGDQSRLAVDYVDSGCRYQMSDYALASSREFWNQEDADEHARTLAQRHGLKLHKVSNLLD